MWSGAVSTDDANNNNNNNNTDDKLRSYRLILAYANEPKTLEYIASLKVAIYRAWKPSHTDKTTVLDRTEKVSHNYACELASKCAYFRLACFRGTLL